MSDDRSDWHDFSYGTCRKCGIARECGYGDYAVRCEPDDVKEPRPSTRVGYYPWTDPPEDSAVKSEIEKLETRLTNLKGKLPVWCLICRKKVPARSVCKVYVADSYGEGVRVTVCTAHTAKEISQVYK